jgi:putative Mg2+ transporter-C (MgtC) family protein
MMISHSEIILRLCLAAFLGSIIGLERERTLWAAGIRTHMLVCVGSCLIMIVSAFGFFDVLGTPHITLDPSRIAAQVVSGIGFLGAGAILLRGNVVRGLTTAASIWAVAGIGLAAGGGLFFPAIFTTFIMMIILLVIKPLEEKFKRKRVMCTLTFYAKQGTITLNLLQEIIGERINHINQLIVQPSELHSFDQITIILTKIQKNAVMEIVEQIRVIPYVKDSQIKVSFTRPVSFR